MLSPHCVGGGPSHPYPCVINTPVVVFEVNRYKPRGATGLDDGLRLSTVKKTAVLYIVVVFVNHGTHGTTHSLRLGIKLICIVPFWGSYSEPKGNSS